MKIYLIVDNQEVEIDDKNESTISDNNTKNLMDK